MTTKWGLAAACAVGVLSTMGTIGTASGAGSTVLDLQLNEPSGSSVAVDSSGSGNDGAIGDRVAMNGEYAHFPYVAPNSGVSYGAEQLVTVPDSGSLDPGLSPFTIEMRYRTTHGFGNVLQKGQAKAAGGQVKLQQPKGQLACMFKTAAGTATASSGTVRLNDGAWHTVKCVRTTSSVTLYVDGVQTDQSDHTTGDLTNDKPWTLGGKPDCDGTKVTCDYFAGDVDYLRLTKG